MNQSSDQQKGMVDTMKQTSLLCGTMLTLLLVLSACAPSAAKTDKTPSPAPTATASAQEESQDGEKAIHGTINRMGSFLVLLTDEGEYHVMDYGQDVTTEGLEEGDTVDITYTGVLDNEEETPVIVSIAKSQ